MSTIIDLICFPFDFVSLKLTAKVGLLPTEVSRNSKFLLERGAVFTAKLPSTRYRQRPLVRGALEISFKVTKKLTKSECTKRYTEPICCSSALLNNFE